MADWANTIQDKIDDLIIYIRNKPVEEMTKTDYDILSAERADIRFQEQQRVNEKRMEQLMAFSAGANAQIPRS